MNETRYEAWVNEYPGNNIAHPDRNTANRKATHHRLALRHVVELRDGERIINEDDDLRSITVEEVRARNRELVQQLRARDFERAGTRERSSSVIDTLKQERDDAYAEINRMKPLVQCCERDHNYDGDCDRNPNGLRGEIEQLEEQRKSAYACAEKRQREKDLWKRRAEAAEANEARLQQFADDVTAHMQEHVGRGQGPIQFACLLQAEWDRIKGILG